MWNRNKKDEEEAPVRSSFGTPPEPAREAIPMSSQTAPRPDSFATRSSAVIGKSLFITGKVTGKEDLQVDGRVEGDIDLPDNRLIVGAGGHVQGGISAKEIVVYGTVQGNLTASERVEIKKNARVLGDVRAARPVIEDEAYFKGSIETMRTEQKPAPPKSVAAVAGAGGVAPATPAEQQGSLLAAQPDSRKGGA
jgi:cytoskeletal protein CcmA (bactofilin family)